MEPTVLKSPDKEWIVSMRLLYMDGSRGGVGNRGSGPPPEKSQKYRVS